MAGTILGPDGKPARPSTSGVTILDPSGKVVSSKDQPDYDPDLSKTVKPTKLAFQFAYDNKRALQLNNASTCPGCGRNAYFPKDSQICYDCAYNGYQKEKIPRNKPCPCGSGKKYKKCCWKQVDKDDA